MIWFQMGPKLDGVYTKGLKNDYKPFFMILFFLHKIEVTISNSGPHILTLMGFCKSKLFQYLRDKYDDMI